MWLGRVVYGVLWILSLVLISFYGGPVSYGIFYLLTFLPVVSFIYLVYVYIFFHMYQRVDSNWLVVDDTSPFYFTLVNDYYVLFSGVRVKFYDDFSTISGLDPATEYEFFPKSGLTLETGITCKCRGEYEVGIKTVVISDYFRLFSLTYKNKEPLKVVVRPKIVKLDSFGDIDVAFSNRESATRMEEPDILTREYVPGDDLRMVHWPITAGTGRLMVRQRTGLKEQGASVLLINRRTGKVPTEYLPVENKMLETVLALSMYMVERNIPVTHYHVEDSIRTVNLLRLEQFDEYYDMVSGIYFEETADVSSFLQNVSGAGYIFESRKLFVVTSEFNISLPEFLKLVSIHNIEVLLCFVGKEIPVEIASLNIPGLKVILIGEQDNLQEVLV